MEVGGSGHEFHRVLRRRLLHGILRGHEQSAVAFQEAFGGKNFALARGNKIISLSPEENEKWSKAVQPILDGYVKSVTEKGLPGAEALGFCQDYLKTHK